MDVKNGKKWGNGETMTGQVVGQVGGCYVFVQSCNLKCLTVSFWLYCYIYINVLGCCNNVWFQ